MKTIEIKILCPFSYAIKKSPIIALYNINKAYVNREYSIIRLPSSYIYLYKNIVIAERVGMNKELIDNLVIDNKYNYKGSDLYFCHKRPLQAIKDGLEIAKQLNFEVKEIQ